MSENQHLGQVRCSFPDQDWSEMPDLTKEQCGSIKRNYMAALGLKPTMPEFMKSKPVAPKPVAKNSAELHSEKQQLNKPADTAQAPKTDDKVNSGGVKLAPRKKTWTAPVKDRAVLTDNKQLAAGAATDQKICEDCTMNYPGGCPVHGPLTQVKDTPSQRNLVAFVRLGAVYYHVCKVVDATEELVVWDEDDFAKELGLTGNAGTQNQAAEVDVAAPSEVFSCEECGDQFTEKQVLENHRRRKHMPKPQGKHQCAHCPYSSNKRTDVTTHERIHTGERPFVCHVCDRGFRQRGSLNRHLLVHTGEKPHAYPDCGQRFARASNMARHRRLHHSAENSRRHVCPECGKGFTQRVHLPRHLLTHTGEKRHACFECGMRFARLDSAQKHVQIVHGRQYPLHCPHCGKGCVKMYDLRRHVHVRHRDEEDHDKENDEDQ